MFIFSNEHLFFLYTTLRKISFYYLRLFLPYKPLKSLLISKVKVDIYGKKRVLPQVRLLSKQSHRGLLDFAVNIKNHCFKDFFLFFLKKQSFLTSGCSFLVGEIPFVFLPHVKENSLLISSLPFSHINHTKSLLGLDA